ncbi:MAG: hypothetical protein AAF447_26185 [Myxococcota bacterium]
MRPWVPTVAALVAACSTAGPARTTLTPQTTQRTRAVVAPVLAADALSLEAGEGVVRVPTVCDRAAGEACNGLEDDCDGRVDEGCGYAAGALQVTVAWNSDADVDLYVIDPSGEALSFHQRRTESGGHLDHDARGACRPQAQERVENAVWHDAPPPGTYRVEAHYLFECDEAGPTTTTVSVATAGVVAGAYNYTLSPNERATLLTFEVPGSHAPGGSER